jgi:hypothetical protein
LDEGFVDIDLELGFDDSDERIDLLVFIFFIIREKQLRGTVIKSSTQ